ncbi:MAG TPA: type II toxin-antitoxin system VapC family toxin [Dermatophilaceae bacterium]|nr:type II toxin-antitoxin system VapC family toxin [Dermatophilaceae bacterium]HPZ68620.1 type II toxin-antitoxin system VapC family toxin [Dermatophilaceae bacterium]HQD01423.1 type II toxin-antitoxin system VapC family toxin [Dermatophilaceae bacterium]
MAFVLDSSVALSWCFEDEVTEATLRIRERLSTERAVVPSLWLLEVANVLLLGARRGRLTAEAAAEFADLLVGLPIDVVEPERDIADLMQLAAEHRLTAYDAAYLQVAAARRLPLATLDATLAEAARAAGVGLLG